MMPPTLSLACVNIEKSRHLERVAAFMDRVQADVFCIQELCENNIDYFASILRDYKYVYEPMTYQANVQSNICLGIFSRLPMKRPGSIYYRGAPGNIPEYDQTDTVTRARTQNNMVLLCDIEKDGALFSVGTTHFTWTPDGKADAIQRHDLSVLLKNLDTSAELILCGDFNSPRGGEIFQILSARFRDNIPPRYTTSIDPKLHRAGPLELMVDGLFTTPGYEAFDVVLHSGVSDHCAITARIARSHAGMAT